MIDYNAAAKILDELMLELIEKGMAIPPHVADDLKSSRSLANIGLKNPDDANIATKTMMYLENAEMNLLSLAETGVGVEYANEWQKRINGAYKEEAVKSSSRPAPKFVTGVPKGKHWVRIQMTELAEIQELSTLLGEYALSAIEQEDGYMLIHGEKENVSAFLKAIRQIIGKNGESICKV